MIQVFNYDEIRHDTVIDLSARSFVVYCRDCGLEEMQEEIETLANNLGFNLLRYTYNCMAFGAAWDEVLTAWVFINPFVKLATIPEPAKRNYKPSVFAAIDSMREIPFDLHLIDLQYPTILTDADKYQWETLPHGWRTVSCFHYLHLVAECKYHYYRPYYHNPIVAEFAEGVVVLHPALPRPLSPEELARCRDSYCFANFIEAELNKLELLPEANFFWSTAIDIRWTHTPKLVDTSILNKYPSGLFPWQNAAKPKDRS